MLAKFTSYLALVLTAGLMVSANAEDSKGLYEGQDAFNTCAGCHSQPGSSNAYPTYKVPKLGGQWGAYIESALTAYKNHERPHVTMHGNAENLTAETMKQIGAYLEVTKIENESNGPYFGDPENGAKLAQDLTCVSCHGANGQSQIAQNPILAGQHQSYLIHALEEYRSGARTNVIMAGQAANLTDEQIADLTAHFASQEEGGLSTVDYDPSK
jgi:cytochrome c553